MIPVILFVYNRTGCLMRTLSCLKENGVSKIYIFSDGAKEERCTQQISSVREIIHGIDWCETEITERDTNLGLGRSILTGVTKVLEKEEMVIVVEDDLVFVPGTYQYLCAALEQYKDDFRVMSVTGYTHPELTPSGITTDPYFDGRAECWVWGTYRRAWDGMMDTDSYTLMKLCKQWGIEPERYGDDLPEMAGEGLAKNIWAVRFIYWHIYNQGLCLRPPWSMVDHIGINGTNVKSVLWENLPNLSTAPPVPEHWPEPAENPECNRLHRETTWKHSGMKRKVQRILARWYREIFV